MQGPKRRKLHERAVKQLSGPDQRLVCALSVGDAMCSLEARAGNRGASSRVKRAQYHLAIHVVSIRLRRSRPVLVKKKRLQMIQDLTALGLKPRNHSYKCLM